MGVESLYSTLSAMHWNLENPMNMSCMVFRTSVAIFLLSLWVIYARQSRITEYVDSSHLLAKHYG